MTLFESYLKIFWMFLIMSFSLVYLFIIRGEEKKTPFFSVSIMRLVMSAFSFISLILSPIMFLALDPSYSGFDFVFVYFYLYVSMLIIYVILLNVDLLRYGVPVLLKKGGLDLKDRDSNLAYQKVMRYIGNGRKR
jgi:hypothetical protein